jgi:non-heme chloroperoxidase
MSTFTSQDGTRIYYKDWGEGQPVVFSHGWPLSADAWESQMVFLASEGYRTSAHDRRGYGRSSQPSEGNDIDTYADDLAELIEALDLQDVILIGHSTGGGEEGGQAYARWLRRSGGGGYDQGRNQGGSLQCATEPRRGAGGRVLLDA